MPSNRLRFKLLTQPRLQLSAVCQTRHPKEGGISHLQPASQSNIDALHTDSRLGSSPSQKTNDAHADGVSLMHTDQGKLLTVSIKFIAVHTGWRRAAGIREGRQKCGPASAA